MTYHDISDVQIRLAGLVGRRVSSGEDAAAVARSVYRDLSVVLVPLVSKPGFDALVARALQLAHRKFPADESPESNGKDVEPFVRIGLWLERQHEESRIEATAAMFAAVAELLVTLIGASLTTRYLRKAWPDGFPDGRAKGKQDD